MAKLTMKQVMWYLMKKYHIPPTVINDIRLAFIDDAVQNANDLHTDRIFSLIALMLHECYGFEQEDICRGLEFFDKMSAEVANGRPWEELMQELHEKTGIVISCESDERLAHEYQPEGMEDDT